MTTRQKHPTKTQQNYPEIRTIFPKVLTTQGTAKHMLGSSLLNAAHWNANGIRKSVSELKDLLRLHKIHIMLIIETKLNSKTNVYVPGYNKLIKDRQNDKTGGGVLILIEVPIRYTELNIDTKNMEAVAIKLSNIIIIVSAYQPSLVKISIEELELIFKLGPKVLLYSDLNAKNMAWKCFRVNSNVELASILLIKDLLKY